MSLQVELQAQVPEAGPDIPPHDPTPAIAYTGLA